MGSPDATDRRESSSKKSPYSTTFTTQITKVFNLNRNTERDAYLQPVIEGSELPSSAQEKDFLINHDERASERPEPKFNLRLNNITQHKPLSGFKITLKNTDRDMEDEDNESKSSTKSGKVVRSASKTSLSSLSECGQPLKDVSLQFQPANNPQPRKSHGKIEQRGKRDDFIILSHAN